MGNSQEKRMKEGRSNTVSQTNCQGIKISKAVSVKHTCKNHNPIDDSQVDQVKNKIGKWSKLLRNISNVLKKNKVEKHSTMVKSQSVKEVLNIEENCQKKKSEEAVPKKKSEEAVPKIAAVKMRRMRSVKMKQREGKAETNEGNQELCKKRILLGGKCKALNVSGVLHYDQNGILLPNRYLKVNNLKISSNKKKGKD